MCLSPYRPGDTVVPPILTHSGLSHTECKKDTHIMCTHSQRETEQLTLQCDYGIRLWEEAQNAECIIRADLWVLLSLSLSFLSVSLRVHLLFLFQNIRRRDAEFWVFIREMPTAGESTNNWSVWDASIIEWMAIFVLSKEKCHSKRPQNLNCYYLPTIVIRFTDAKWWRHYKSSC